MHGKSVADYVRRSTGSAESREVVYRVVSYGLLPKQAPWTRHREACAEQIPSNSDWTIAKITASIRANLDLLTECRVPQRAIPLLQPSRCHLLIEQLLASAGDGVWIQAEEFG